MALTLINADGWSATYGSPPTFDPVGAPETFTVARAGFDATGAAVTVNDTVTLMKRLRQPYPNQATLTADQVVLSDFVYSGETISGVTNNSTRPAPKPIAMWLTRDLRRATSSTFAAKLAVAHAHGRNGRPVAAVKFIASDGTNTVEQTVSAMSSQQWAASGFYAAFFECSLNIATLNQGALCTLDAIIYPWVGAAFQLSVHADTYPSANLTTQRFLCDRTGAYGTAYAYVDGVGAGTPQVSTTAATAEANPYATVAAAAAAIQTFNNANFGRNSASGGIVRLKAGTHARTSFSSVVVTDIPLIVEADSPANKASVIFTDNAASASDGIPDKLVLKDMTLRKLGASIIFLDNAASLATMGNLLALENIHIDQNGQSAYDAWIYRPGRLWLENVTGGWSSIFNSFSTVSKHIHMVGCTGAWQADSTYAVAASRVTASRIKKRAAMANGMETKGMFVGWNHLTNTTDSQNVFYHEGADSRGVALVMTVLEQTAGLTGPALWVAADTDLNPIENFVRVGVTVAGARSNVLYNDTGSTATAKSGYAIGCVDRGRNTKSDLFGTQDGGRIGNWPAVFRVGHRHNAVIRGGQDGLAPGATGAWVGEAAELGLQSGTDASPLAVAWANDASFDGSKAGGGDYTPGAGSVLGTLPGGYVHYPLDMLGRPILTDGSAVLGALQKAAAGIDGSATSSLDLTGTATGSVDVSGAGASDLTPGGAATGTVDVTGAASGDLTPGGTAAGAVDVTGAGSGDLTPGSAASGGVSVDGAASGDLTPGGLATGTVSAAGSIDGQASGDLTPTGAASGTVDIAGGTAGDLTPGGAAAGTVDVAGAATGDLTPGAASSGAVDVAGAASSQIDLTGTATGDVAAAGTITGQGGGAIDLTGSASGTVDVAGAGTSDLTPGGAAAGTVSGATGPVQLGVLPYSGPTYARVISSAVLKASGGTP